MNFLARVTYYYKKGTFQHGMYALIEAENMEEAHKKLEAHIKEKYPDMTIEKITVGETIK